MPRRDPGDDARAHPRRSRSAVATPAEVRRATREAESRGLPLDADHVSTKTDSELEDDFFALCTRYGVPAA